VAVFRVGGRNPVDWREQGKERLTDMKQYVIDQLREPDYEAILDYLDKNALKTVMEGVYRVEIPEDHYTQVQLDHVDCRPFYFAVTLDPRHVAFELLVRSLERLRCNCIAYATPRQREFILHFADNMLEELGIRI
jgi:hypothetical protein